MKTCGYCAEDIREDAIVCRYCGRDLVLDSDEGRRTPPPASPKWGQTGLAVVVAGVVPPILVNFVLVAAIASIGYGVASPSFRTPFLVFYFLVHLLPLALGVWAGLAWPGKHPIGNLLIGMVAGVIEGVALFVIIVSFGGLIVLAAEDYIAIPATAILFAAGGQLGDVIEGRRSVYEYRRSAPGIGANGSPGGGSSPTLMAAMGPAALGLVGTIITAAATLAKGVAG